MAHIQFLKTTAKNVLHEIALHAFNLGSGLQNISPVQDGGSPAKSIQYLLETSKHLEQASHAIDNLSE